MQFQSVRYYLFKLISDGHKWQHTDINGLCENPKFYFSGLQWLIIVISFISSFLLAIGFNKDFIGYIIASLSIFIGLFLTLILTVFDRFQNINFSTPNLSENEQIKLIQKKNFFKQFTALTSYSILISLLSIILLSLSLLSNFFNVNISQFSLVSDIESVSIEYTCNFLIISIVLIYRIVVIYFLLDFLIIVLFALTSIYNYISLEYDKVKIKK